MTVACGCGPQLGGSFVQKRLLIGLLSAGLVVTMLPGVAAAKDKDNDACKKGGWAELLDDNGQPFASQGECVDHVSEGGTTTAADPFVIAYADLNDNDVFDAGDVLIAKLVDADGSGQPSVGDLVVLDRYPTTLSPTSAADFAEWKDKQHRVTALDPMFPGTGLMEVSAPTRMSWRRAGDRHEYFSLEIPIQGAGNAVWDDWGEAIYPDFIIIDAGLVGRAKESVDIDSDRESDDNFIDTEWYSWQQ